MAAMTRLRCDPKDGVPTPLVAEYYAQRAGSGLIITECAAWSQRGVGFPGAGHMFNQ
jgi:N-ethylmaleimide reductase